MNKMICNICGSDHIVEYDYCDGIIFAECEICNARGDTNVFTHYETVFDKIAASLETLAENLVYCVPVPLFEPGAGLERWYTVFSPFDVKKYFRTKEEAIAATIEKLKEVAVENGQ